jgi:RNase P subunit RPR2
VSLSRFDIEATERHRMMQREEIAAEISRIDEQLCRKLSRTCPRCGETMHGHGRTPSKELWTLAGPIHVRIRRFYCRACGQMLVPAGGLVAEGLLSSLAQKFVSLCRRNSFEQSRIQLRDDFGIDIPVMTLHAYVRAQAHYFDDGIVRAAEELFSSGVAPEPKAALGAGRPLYLAIDEGLVRDWSHTHGAQRSETAFNTAYCAVFFDGRRLATKSEDAKKRYALTNRYGHVSATVDADAYFRELVALSYQRGYTSSHLMFVLTDGARYLTSRIEEFFPHAIPLLDIYHLKRKVFELVAADSLAASRMTEAICSYSPSRLICLVEGYLVADERLREKKRKLLTYIRRNARAIRNHRHPEARVHGSASAEKVVDLVVARRFKGRGMSWTEPGLETLLRFQVMDYNGELEGYWNARHDCLVPKNPAALERRSLDGCEPEASRLQGDHYYHQATISDHERTKGVIPC